METQKENKNIKMVNNSINKMIDDWWRILKTNLGDEVGSV